MSDLIDIKDRTPNADLVRHLETMLQQAKEGTLRSYAVVCGWDDDAWSHTWVIDPRNTRRRLIGEVSMMQFDLLTAVSVFEGDNILSEALNGEL